MSIRKTRMDKGTVRGPRTSERKQFLIYFARLDPVEQESLLDDLELMQEMREFLTRPVDRKSGATASGDDVTTAFGGAYGSLNPHATEQRNERNDQ